MDELLKQFAAAPTLEISLLFKRVKAGVEEHPDNEIEYSDGTRGPQIPWTDGNVAEFYFFQ
jgi:hypothetical protein